MLERAVQLSDHTMGSPAAPVTLVHYGDYSSAESPEADALVRSLTEGFGTLVRYVYRHLARPELRPQAERAAEAAEAAAVQRRFWQMHALLVAQPGGLDDGALVGYAASLGLDMQRFLRDVAGHIHISRIRDEARAAARSGATSAPSFFINGARFRGDWRAVGSLAAQIDGAVRATDLIARSAS